jgi:salicylate hydroxylase
MKNLNIAIVGGGIGGLFAAHAALARGFRVAVYEQAPALGEVGAGVLLTPNSVRQLERCGLGEAVATYGARIGPSSRYRRHDGAEIAPVQITDSSGWNAVFGMHRADLVTLLSEALPRDIIFTDHRCTGFEQDEHAARLRFQNGTTTEANLVIGADGIHSVLRDAVAPASTPVFSGSIAYRGVAPHALVPDFPQDAWQMWLGPGKHFLTFPLRAGSLVNFVGFVPADDAMRESWSAPGDPDRLRAEFAGWDGCIERLLAHVKTTFRWALYDREPLPTWINARLALLGDAAHPMLPHLGQGANQSIEDGIALASLLADADDIGTALRLYDQLRRERVAGVQRGARQNGLRYDSSYSDLGLRDAEIKAHAAFRRTLYDYDVVREVAALAPSTM